MARQAMLSRRQFVQTSPERVKPLNFHFPLWRAGAYKPWQVDLALRILASLAPGDVPLDVVVSTLSRLVTLRSLGNYVISTSSPASPPSGSTSSSGPTDLHGRGARRRTARRGSAQLHAGEAPGARGVDWRITLGDATDSAAEANVTARVVLNMAGIWIDRVNRTAGEGQKRKITGTKGAHIMVQLPPDCAEMGSRPSTVSTSRSTASPGAACAFGPTETVYEGDLDDIHATEEEIAGLIDGANHLMPGLNLRRRDVIFTWAGCGRSLTIRPPEGRPFAGDPRPLGGRAPERPRDDRRPRGDSPIGWHRDGEGS